MGTDAVEVWPAVSRTVTTAVQVPAWLYTCSAVGLAFWPEVPVPSPHSKLYPAIGVASVSVDPEASRCTESGLVPLVGEAISFAAGGLSVAATVVNDQVGAAAGIWLPARSLALIDNVYFVDKLNAALGAIVTVFVVDAYVVVNGTTVFPEVNVTATDAGWIGSLKVAVGFTVTAAPTVPLLGVVAVTVGGVRSVLAAADATAGVEVRRPVSRRMPAVRPRMIGIFLTFCAPGGVA